MTGARYWRTAEPKAAYDVVVVGGGGHGLSTAYYLAKNHGISDVCILERWLAGGEAGPLARPHSLERFTTGALIDEHGAAGVAH